VTESFNVTATLGVQLLLTCYQHWQIR